MKKQKPKPAATGNGKVLLILVIILAAAFFLRFHRLSGLFQWSLDEEYWAYLPYNIATGYHFPLIGGHISGTGLYSGPLFVWLMAVPFFIFQGHPLGAAAIVSLLGVITVFLTYKVGRLFYGRTAGLVAAFLASFSSLMVIYDRKYWNASPIPFLSLAAILCLYRISRGYRRYYYFLPAVLALAFHAHMTGAVLLLFTAAALWSIRKTVDPVMVRRSLLIFFVLQLPLVLFELRHGFTNTGALFHFFSAAGRTNGFLISAKEVFFLFTNTFSRLFYLPSGLDLARELTLCSSYAGFKYLPPVWVGLTVIIFLVWFFVRRSDPGSRLLKLMLGLNFFALFFYRLKAPQNSWYSGQLGEYYLFPAFPVVFLAIASFAKKAFTGTKIKSVAVLILLSVFFVINSVAVLTLRHSSGFEKTYNLVNNCLSQVGDRPFVLNVRGDDPCRIYGYRYLFTYLKREPEESYLDPQFSWLYAGRLSGQPAAWEIGITYQNGNVACRVEPLD